MARWKLTQTTITYAGREIIAPGACLEDTTAALNWGYTAETVELVGRARPALRTRGNTAGSLSLPVVTDYDSADAAFAAAVELRAWAEGAQSGDLVICAGEQGAGSAPAAPPVETVGTGSLGDNNLNAVYIELDARYSRAGNVQKVAYKCRPGAIPDTAPLYLAIWEQEEQGGDNWARVALSENTQSQAAGAWMEFAFNPAASELHGRAFRLALTDDPGGAWQNSHLMGLAASNTPEGDATYCKGQNGSRYNYLPQVSIEYQLPREQGDAPTVRETATPGALTYTAALASLNISLTLAPHAYRMTAAYDFILT